MYVKDILRIELKKQYAKEDLGAYISDSIDKVEKLNIFTDALSVVSYNPFPDEIDFLTKLESKYPGKTWYVVSKYGHKDVSDIVADISRLREPVCVFVPARAVDREGNRIGRGGGFYDRLLSHITMARLNMRTVCVLPDFAYLERIPQESHDHPVETVIVSST